MTDPLRDIEFWWRVLCLALGVFLGALVLLASFLLARRRPSVIGALRPRCEICEDAWAVPSTDDDLDLCPDCRSEIDEAEERQAAWDREVLR